MQKKKDSFSNKCVYNEGNRRGRTVQDKLIRSQYLLSISLIITSIIYFFASNWGGFSKWDKIGLSVGLIVLFYVVAVLAANWLSRYRFLGNWLFFAASLAFGIGIALLGQIYNSHADSYWLFLLWFIPTVAFAIVTKYRPFSVLAYLLFHLAYFTYFFPTGAFWIRGPFEEVGIVGGLALLNGILFMYLFVRKSAAKELLYLSYSMFHVFAVSVSFFDRFGGVGLLITCLQIILLIVALKYFSVKQKRGLQIVTIVITTIVAFIKYTELSFEVGGGFFFFGGSLIGVVIVVVGSVKVLQLLKKQSESGATSRALSIIKHVLIICLTLFCAFTALSSITGLLFLIVPQAPEYPGFVIAIIFIYFSGYRLFRSYPTVQYTLLITGLLLACSISMMMSFWWSIVLLLVIFYMMKTLPYRGTRVILYTALHPILFVLYWRMLEEFYVGIWGHPYLWELAFIGFLVMNIIVWSASKLPYLRVLSFCLALITAYVLSFQGEHLIYYVYNLVFLVVSFLLVYDSYKKKQSIQLYVGYFVWFVYLFTKYYEYGWKLLHKSLSFLLIGLLIGGIAYWLERRNGDRTPVGTFIFTGRKPLLIIIIVVQFLMIGGITFIKEQTLANGTDIKLKLEPVDPRSMLQGDYVQLRYTISDLPISKKVRSGKRIAVILRSKENGVYGYSGYYQYEGKWNKSYVKKAGDVKIVGKTTYNGVEYGIEHFFVEEGTGFDLQQHIRYGHVKVAENGDALLLDVTKK